MKLNIWSMLEIDDHPAPGERQNIQSISHNRQLAQLLVDFKHC